MKPGLRVELVTPDGERFDLHNPPDRAVFGLSGFGLSPREISTVRNPYQHGETPLSQRLQPRTVNFTFRWNGYCPDDLWGRHGTLIDYFRENRVDPLDTEPHQLVLHFTENSVYKSRALDVFFTDGMVFSPPREGQWDNFSVTEELTFTAFNPLVYDPTQITATISTLTEQLVLPMTFPFILGAYQGTTNIVYGGTWEEFPVIEIAGPAKNVSIFNLTTDRRLDYTGEILGGDTLTIDLRWGYKTVVDVCGNELIQHLFGDIGAFSLQCDPLVSGGTNQVKVTTESYDPAFTRVHFKYYTRYRGV